MFNKKFEDLRLAIKKRDEERYELLKEEIKKLRDTIEHYLTLFFESTSSKAQTNYSNLQMY